MNPSQFTTLRQKGYFQEISTEYDFYTMVQSDYVGNKWGSSFPDTFREHQIAHKWNRKLARKIAVK